MYDSPLEATVDRFVNRENIKRYRQLASEATDETERARIMKLLAEEEAKFKLELRRRDGAREGRPPVNSATENRLEHDGGGQQGGG